MFNQKSMHSIFKMNIPKATFKTFNISHKIVAANFLTPRYCQMTSFLNPEHIKGENIVLNSIFPCTFSGFQGKFISTESLKPKRFSNKIGNTWNNSLDILEYIGNNLYRLFTSGYSILNLQWSSQIPQDRPESEFSDEEIFTEEENKIPETEAEKLWKLFPNPRIRIDESDISEDDFPSVIINNVSNNIPMDEEIFTAEEHSTDIEDSDSLSTDEEDISATENIEGGSDEE